VIFLPRQFQVTVVENVNERHLKRAAWAFPMYML
jgi:Na+/proline symporter